MHLSEIGLTATQQKELEKHNIKSVEAFLRKEPLRYNDFTTPEKLSLDNTSLMQKMADRVPVAIIGTLTYSNVSRKDKITHIKLRIIEEQGGNTLFIMLIGKHGQYKEICDMMDKPILVCGLVTYSNEYKSFSMLNPILMSKDIKENLRIHPVYSNYNKFSCDTYKSKINEALQQVSSLDYIPHQLLQKLKLPDFKTSVQYIHRPANNTELQLGRKRAVFDNLLYFALKLESQKSFRNNETPFFITKTEKTENLERSLPFTLTKDQKECLDALISMAKNKKRINALIEGDVGCGKSIIIFLLMHLMAENGYQSILMAPTTSLASQHYDELLSLTGNAENITLLTSDMKASEKRAAYESIASGKSLFIVGTQSVLSNKVIYNNVSLVITDEEHKFGVVQREALKDKAAEGVHQIILSATPIPRTIAGALYADILDVYTIRTKPGNRKPIQTATCKNDITVFNFIEKELAKGHQAYIVCPAITASSEYNFSVEAKIKAIKDFFEGKGRNIATLTGKTPKSEAQSVLRAFKNNEVQILVATSIIEVGINVPNATVIAITGAERFGLAMLHQLRGRVGRGAYNGYCILQTEYPETERLQVLCNETDGFNLTLEDMKLRGSGDLIGIKQSGHEKNVHLMLEYPNMFAIIKNIAKAMFKDDTGKDIIKMYESKFTPEN